MEKDTHAKWKPREQESLSDRYTLGQNSNKRQGHYTMINGSICQEYKTIVNKHTPNLGAPKYIKKILRSEGRNITI